VNEIHFLVKKRLFIGLLTVSLMLVGFLVGTVWYLATSPSNTLFNQVLLLSVAALLVGGILLAACGVAGIVLTIWWARNIRALQGPMRLAVNLFFPLALAIGRFLKIDKDRIKRSFIEVNNFIVRSRAIKILPRQVLLLLPHCLQKSDCPHKITVNIDNCHRCGGCVVGEILNLRDKYGIKVGVATGGTLARKYVEEFRPRAIVAVACERDLTSGIQDAYEIPVLGVTNERPNGPCFNTLINVPKIEEAIRFFLENGGRRVNSFSLR